MKCADYRELELGKTGIVRKKIIGGKRAISRVNTDREIQGARLLIQ
jgi:hypothetical protein